MGPRSLTWTHGHFNSGRGSGGTVCGASQTECVHLLTPRASGERREGHRGPFCRVVDAGRPPGPGSVWGTAARVLDRPGQYFNLMNDRLVEGRRPIFLNLKAQNCCEEDRSSLPPLHPPLWESRASCQAAVSKRARLPVLRVPEAGPAHTSPTGSLPRFRSLGAVYHSYYYRCGTHTHTHTQNECISE